MKILVEYKKVVYFWVDTVVDLDVNEFTRIRAVLISRLGEVCYASPTDLRVIDYPFLAGH